MFLAILAATSAITKMSVATSQGKHSLGISEPVKHAKFLHFLAAQTIREVFLL